jgi:hypothetical protein
MINWDLNEIFEEAKLHRQSIVTSLRKGTSVLYSGIKIQKFGDRIEIMNMGKGGDYFKECTLEEYDYFYKDGWEKGVLQVAMNNCIYKLQIIENRIKTEVNTRKNDKHIQKLKTRRENILNKYTKKKIKFNQLK